MGNKEGRALAFTLAAALAVPSLWASDRPDGLSLVMEASRPPAAYQGRVMLTRWSDGETIAREANVYYQPPDRYRFEFLTVDGRVDGVVVRDGGRQRVEKTASDGGEPFTSFDAALLPANDQLALLSANYRVRLTGEDEVVGRPAWTVEIVPLTPGKPVEKIAIDQKSHVILESRRVLPSGRSGALSRFTRFETKAALPDSLFTISDLTPRHDVPVAPLDKEPSSDAPDRLFSGFQLTGSDLLDVDGHPVRHLEYTDGLLPLSVFESTLPTGRSGRPIKTDVLVTDAAQASPNVEAWSSAGRYYTMVGELSPVLMRRVAGPFR